MRKLTTEEFINRSKAIHGERYDYSLSIYQNRRIKVKIICKTHGIFEQYPDLHCQRGHGCGKCGGTSKLTIKEFVNKAISIHGNKYDYSDVVYVNQKGKIKIFCKRHGIFLQAPHDHLQGRGCPHCYKSQATKEVFIQKANTIHNFKYDYSESVYIDSRTRLKIICPIHGEFWQQPNNHIEGRGCIKCGRLQQKESKKIGIDNFVSRANQIHGNRYDYSKSEYVGIYDKICIICPQHGEYWQRASDHLDGSGCSKCRSSTGEIKVSEVLNDLGINFIPEKRFKRIGNHRFDFYFKLYDKEFLIEYDGIQHFQNIDYWGFDGSLTEIKRRDAIKTQFAHDNGFILIRIPYTEFDNIETILRTEIKNHLS